MEDIILALANEITKILNDSGYKIKGSTNWILDDHIIIQANKEIVPGWCGGEIQLQLILKDNIQVVAYLVPYTTFINQFLSSSTFELQDNDCLTKLTQSIMNVKEWLDVDTRTIR